MNTYKEIYNKLPNNWDEVTLRDYIKLSPALVEPEEDVFPDPDIITNAYLLELDKNIQIISLLTDSEIEAVEQLTMVQLDNLISKISFLSAAPKSPKTSIKFKQFKDLTYDNFITFEKLSVDFKPETILSSAIHNLPMMLSVFSADSKDEEYFLNLSMPEVIAAFFTVAANTKRYLNHLEAFSYKKLMTTQKNQLKNLMMFYWQKVNPLKKSSMKTGTIG